MKKVLLSLLAVAALVLSCQNYDDEFAALNAKVASLESQITSLSGLQTALTQVQSSVSALQAAVSAIPDLSSEVAAILADLESLASDVAGATTSADLDALKAELNTSLAALQALIEANSASIANLVLSNTELKEALGDLGVDVDSILAANATFEGDLTITNAAELAYAKSLGNKVSTIRGNVYVVVDETKHTGGGTGEGLTAAEVASVTSQITYVVGNVKIDSDVDVDLSKLASVSGDYIILNSDVSDDALLSVGGNVHFDYDGAYKSNIQTAGNIFLVAKAKAAAVAATSTPARLGTTSIDFLALTKATGVQTVSSTEAAAHTSGASVTYDSNEADKTIALVTSVAGASTTSVKIGQAPVISVSGGAVLSTVELHYAADYNATTNPTGSAALASLSISAEGLTSATVMAEKITAGVTISVTKTAATPVASVSFPNLTSAGAIVSDAEVTGLSKLKTAGGLTLSYDTSVSLPELTSSTGDIILTRATSFSAPKLARVAAKIATGSTEAATAGKAITANLVAGDISFPALTKAGAVSFDLATSFVAPKATISSIDLEEAEVTVSSTTGAGTVVVGVSIDVMSVSPQPLSSATAATNGSATTALTNEVFANAEKITSLILRGQDVVLDLNEFELASSITYIGKANAATGAPAAGTLTVGTANELLTTLTLGGVIGTVDVDTAETNVSTGKEGINIDTALTTINTSGTILSLTVENNFDLTTINALHTDLTTGTTASTLVVKDNVNLTTLKTGITTFASIDIQNNFKLSSLDLSSVVSLPNNWVSNSSSASLQILNNFIDKAETRVVTGTYSTVYGLDAVDAVASNPLSTFTGMTGTKTAATAVAGLTRSQSGLATLKTFFTSLDTKFRLDDGDLSDSRGIDIDVNYEKIADVSASPLTTDTELVTFTGVDTTTSNSRVTNLDAVLSIN